MGERGTVDLVILAITAVIGFVVVFSMIGIVVIELFRPAVDTSSMIRLESEILGVLVGALVGFVGGRATGRTERPQ